MKVSADHVVPKYGCKNLPVRVGAAYDVVDGERVVAGYYVTIEGYGCSKTYKTAREAVHGMLAEHACTNIRVED